MSRPRSACWHWPGSHFPNGRARFKGNHTVIALWTMAHGKPVPEGHDLHHTCGHVWCVNPWHVRPVPRSTHGRHHARTMSRKRKDVCVNGHDRTDPAMVYARKRKDGRTEHVCRGCARMYKRQRRERLSHSVCDTTMPSEASVWPVEASVWPVEASVWPVEAR